MCHLRLSSGDEQARTKWTCFCSMSSLPPFPSLQSLVAKHEKRLVALEAFQVGRLELFTRKDSIHSTAALLYPTATNVFRPKRGASPPKLLAHSLGVGAQKDASAVVGARNMEETGSTGRRTKNTRARHSFRALTITIVVVRQRRRFPTCAPKSLRYHSVRTTAKATLKISSCPPTVQNKVIS